VPITVVYLDSHERGHTEPGSDGAAAAECEVHSFEPSSEGAGAIAAAAGRRRPHVHLLYRPGHYDIACEWFGGV